MKRFFKHIFLLLFILTSVAANAQTGRVSTTHKVEAGETVYGISHKYGITTDELRNANPRLIDSGMGVKAGDVIVIPEKKNTAVDKNSGRGKSMNIGVMLPLNNGSDGKNMVEYYRGILMACEKLKHENFNINVHAWDVARSTDLENILKDNAAARCDVIFGPFYSHQVSRMSEFSKKHGIRLVVPFAAGGMDLQNNPNMFVLSEFNPSFDENACRKFMSLFDKKNIVIIDCNDDRNAKGDFTSVLRSVLDQEDIKYSITNINSDDAKFLKAFKKNRNNIVVLNSSGSNAFDSAVFKIKLVRKKMPEAKISILGYHEWFSFEKYKLDKFAANDVYIPTYFYYNPHSAATIKIESDYFRWFKNNMIQSVPRYAIAGYDHADFFLRGINRFGSSFTGAKEQNTSSQIQMPLHFNKVSLNGGHQNSAFMFIHYKNDKSIESIAY